MPASSRDEAVSEVVGHILTFAILAVTFVLSTIAFQAAQESARDRVLQLTADSTAARVAGVLVEAGLLGEEHGAALTVSHRIDLPQQLEGLGYVVRLETLPSGVSVVEVEVPAAAIQATAPLLSVAASPGVGICDSEAPGGPIRARYDVQGGSRCLFVESAA